MKARIVGHDLIVLTPEGDAEFALMRFWSQMQARKANYVFENGKVTSLSIAFHKSPPEVKVESPRVD